jgi:hypothetical protein
VRKCEKVKIATIEKFTVDERTNERTRSELAEIERVTRCTR